MPITIFAIHGEAIAEIPTIIHPDRSSIGKTVAAPATSAEATSKATSATHAAGPTAADIKIKQAGVYVVKVSQYGDLPPFLEITIRSRQLITLLGTTADTEISEVTIIPLRRDFEVKYALRVTRTVTSHVSHVAIVIYNLNFFDDLRRQVLNRRLDVSTKKIFPVDTRPSY